MSLQVQNLSKIYGQQKAVDNISFELGAGEIVGFLGPNGAGKSTTMKIATGYLPPSSGTVKVGGFDIVDQPMLARRITGYLPEHNPLYLDLYVHEYLSFVGKLYGLAGKELSSRVTEMVERCGLVPEQNKRIETLSKGYRQRVGLAQALIHDPQILILDEPTTGLDPNQLVEIRKLIKDMSSNKTVIFSTHIMQEVQALCDRVIVIHQGQIVADNRLDHILKASNSKETLVAEFSQDVSIEVLESVAGVEQVTQQGKGLYRILAKTGTDVRPEIFRMAADKNLSLIGLRQEENSLEAIFRELTQVNSVEH
jgi:ABC-2 type transport system ATP-binding protein